MSLDGSCSACNCAIIQNAMLSKLERFACNMAHMPSRMQLCATQSCLRASIDILCLQMHWGGCDALFEAVHTVAVRTVLILGAPSASWLSFISQERGGINARLPSACHEQACIAGQVWLSFTTPRSSESHIAYRCGVVQVLIIIQAMPWATISVYTITRSVGKGLHVTACSLALRLCGRHD